MATLMTPEKLQKIEFDVTTAEGPSRVTTVTGAIPIFLSVFSQGSFVTQKDSFKVLLDPTLTPGQFRKATAMACFAQFSSQEQQPIAGTQNAMGWQIDDAQATLDDETGKVQLVVDVAVTALGSSMSVIAQSLIFQVTTLAKV
jgi:hypothetical protein